MCQLSMQGVLLKLQVCFERPLCKYVIRCVYVCGGGGGGGGGEVQTG